jgi:hypothetical protein
MTRAMTLRLLLAAVLLVACTHRAPPVVTSIEDRPPAAALPAQEARPAPDPPSAPAPVALVPARVVDFARDVRPILEARCQPCHFTGGRMHEKLPFDRPETVLQLGTRLFSRIKAEDEQRLISEFLAQAR